MRSTPSYQGLRPASSRASEAARASSKKTNTRCELLLRRRLWEAGCRYITDVRDLPGRPDIVFPRARVVVFCDGDYWHGRGWEQRKLKLKEGHNAAYWLKKISTNMERDRRNTRLLEAEGWRVIRVWESDIRKDIDRIVEQILQVLDAAGHRRAPR
jgi:DNA mismatch endonuclease (patch repair protein)